VEEKHKQQMDPSRGNENVSAAKNGMVRKNLADRFLSGKLAGKTKILRRQPEDRVGKWILGARWVKLPAKWKMRHAESIDRDEKLKRENLTTHLDSRAGMKLRKRAGRTASGGT
jgi:hypothetical protein